MRKVLRVNPKTHLVCIPHEMIEDGMVGDVNSYPNAVTLTLVTPGANLEDVRDSLERTLDDIKQRMRFIGRGASEKPEPVKHPGPPPKVDKVKEEPKSPEQVRLDEMRRNLRG